MNEKIDTAFECIPERRETLNRVMEDSSQRREQQRCASAIVCQGTIQSKNASLKSRMEDTLKNKNIKTTVGFQSNSSIVQGRSRQSKVEELSSKK